jgi:hypothetical protein
VGEELGRYSIAESFPPAFVEKRSDPGHLVVADLRELDAVGGSLNDLHHDQRLLRSFFGWYGLAL